MNYKLLLRSSRGCFFLIIFFLVSFLALTLDFTDVSVLGHHFCGFLLSLIVSFALFEGML